LGRDDTLFIPREARVVLISIGGILFPVSRIYDWSVSPLIGPFDNGEKVSLKSLDFSEAPNLT